MRKLTMRLVPAFLMMLLALPALADDKPRVVAVNYALQFMAAEILGDDAEVIYPVPESVDPSFWRPGISDISAIQSADLILLNGAGFAGWTAKVSLPRAKLVVTSRGAEDRFIATETITHSHGDGGEHSHEGTASYLWLDPELAKLQAGAIAEAAKRKDLAEATEIDARLVALEDALDDIAALGASLRETAGGTTFIATHPRYQYLARAFGLTVVSLDWEAGAAPDAEQLSALKDLAAETDASVLIWEAEPPAGARSAVTALGLQDAVFPPLATRPATGDFLGILEEGLTGLKNASAAAANG